VEGPVEMAEGEVVPAKMVDRYGSSVLSIQADYQVQEIEEEEDCLIMLSGSLGTCG